MKLIIAIAALALLANVEAGKPSRKPEPEKPDVSKLPQRGNFDENTAGFDYVKPYWLMMVNNEMQTNSALVTENALLIVNVLKGSWFERNDQKGEIHFRFNANYGWSNCSLSEVLYDEEKQKQCLKDVKAEIWCPAYFSYYIEGKTWNMKPLHCETIKN